MKIIGIKDSLPQCHFNIGRQSEKTFPIRSYVRRQGRMLNTQKRALDELWQYYGVDEEGKLDPDALFGRQAPLHLEIGFGMGNTLLEMACAHPENNYLGIEVHLPGVGQLFLRLQEMNVTNVRIYCRDAIEVLDFLPTHCLAEVYLFFPDPWPKIRHHKRRLVRPAFVEKLARVLVAGGGFYVVTDCENYARHIEKVMEGATDFNNRVWSGKSQPGMMELSVTKFEQRGLHRGHKIVGFLYDRI